MIEKIAAEIDENFKCIQINFGDIFWNKDIPPEAGWYTIRTNTPLDVLKFAGPPKYKAHINIPKLLLVHRNYVIPALPSSHNLEMKITLFTTGKQKILKPGQKNTQADTQKRIVLVYQTIKFCRNTDGFFAIRPYPVVWPLQAKKRMTNF